MTDTEQPRTVRSWQSSPKRGNSSPVYNLRPRDRQVTPKMQAWMNGEHGTLLGGVYCCNRPLLLVDKDRAIAHRNARKDARRLWHGQFEWSVMVSGSGSVQQWRPVSGPLVVGCPIGDHAGGHDIDPVLLTLALNRAIEKIDVRTVTSPTPKSK
jgi:hypothetical protein